MTEVPNWFLWVNLLAIIAGPILAVIVGSVLARRSSNFDRRMAIFRDLMRHRRTILNTEYVGALNLVEVEFNKYPAVISRWRDLYEHLNNPTIERDLPDAWRKWNDKTDRLHILLIHAIARSSKLPIEQLDIVAGYAPRAWEDNEGHQRQIQEALLKVLNGETQILTSTTPQIEPHDPFPNPPS